MLAYALARTNVSADAQQYYTGGQDDYNRYENPI